MSAILHERTWKIHSSGLSSAHEPGGGEMAKVLMDAKSKDNMNATKNSQIKDWLLSLQAEIKDRRSKMRLDL